MALIGGAWPAAVSTAMPWPFCTTSTVIASGTTSSTMAVNENSGRWSRGSASRGTWSRPGAKVPVAAMTPAPAASATISGGRRAESAAGAAPASRNAAVIVAAITGSLWNARTQSSPNCRNTPATMPITIGIGNACMARRTHPVAPSTSIRTPVAMKAPIDLGEGEVAQRRADENGAGDGPEKRQRLAIRKAEGDADETVDEKCAEQPRRQVGLAQSAFGAGRQDDDHRSAGGEQERDQSAGDAGDR